ncbi:hypothetical protein ACFLZM_02545 [Thermodesulfobacteriota bacterium]
MNAETPWFDGPEKKLDIFLFSPAEELLAVSDEKWRRVVKASGSRIVSKISSHGLNAFILSESSLFIWPDRIMMMTCGQTTLANALPGILAIVGKQNVMRVLYERKTFFSSAFSHVPFENETAPIKNLFPGQINRCGPAGDDHLHLFISSHAQKTTRPEAALQLFMHELKPSLVKIFSSANGKNGELVANRLGLSTLYPFHITDSYLFSPCGFSMNGILNGHYSAIHVTPQTKGSYASFETDMIENDFTEKVKQLVSIFRPGKLSLVLKTGPNDYCHGLHSEVKIDLKGCRLTENVLHRLNCGSVVSFLNYRCGSI